ncbi:MAG TPA: TonB family protein [Opitutaceae bacterium]|nr:TonB family protein [Opitutaceae bacterium]
MTTPSLLPLVLAALALLGARRPDGYEPPKVHQTVEARFPAALLDHPRIHDGEATVMILVDASGLIADSLVTRYTHPLFGKEALETAHRWRFEPARLRGEPVGVRMQLNFSFERGRRVVNVADPEAFEAHLRNRVEGPYQGDVRRVRLARELDEPLVVVDQVHPMPPGPLGARRASGHAVVEFYVDEQGRPRLPVVVAADDDAFGRSALEAIAQWRFSVPRAGGWPVMVLARQRFDFTETASGPSAAAGASAAELENRP